MTRQSGREARSWAPKKNVGSFYSEPQLFAHCTFSHHAVQEGRAQPLQGMVRAPVSTQTVAQTVYGGGEREEVQEVPRARGPARCHTLGDGRLPRPAIGRGVRSNRRGCGSVHVEQLLTRATPGKSQWMLAVEHGCSQATVSRSVRGVDQKTGNPVGRPMKTTRAERDMVRDLKDANPFGRHKDIAAAAAVLGLHLNEKQIASVLAYKEDPNSGRYGRKASNRKSRSHHQPSRVSKL